MCDERKAADYYVVMSQGKSVELKQVCINCLQNYMKNDNDYSGKFSFTQNFIPLP